MPTNVDPLAAYDIGQTLLTCVEEQLAEVWSRPVYDEIDPGPGTPRGVPPRSCVITGGIAWDDCECGQLIVSINNIYPSTLFPTIVTSADGANSQSRCGAPLVVIEYFVNILRCSPVGVDDPHPPSCESLSAAARVTVIDAWATRIGSQCCLMDLTTRQNGVKPLHDFFIGNQSMVGADGGCQGSELQVFVGINHSCPCNNGNGS